MAFAAEFGLGKPVCRELILAVGHVFPSKHTKLKHFFGGEFWVKVGMKVFARRFIQHIMVVVLHDVIHGNNLRISHSAFFFPTARSTNEEIFLISAFFSESVG